MRRAIDAPHGFFIFQKKITEMKLLCQIVAALLVVLSWSNCKKEHELIPEKNQKYSEQLPLPGAILLGCDDTTAFKSSVDLQPLEYLKNCYSCTAIKQVPGLGEIPWVGNCQVYVAWDSVLYFRFLTYEPYFDELLPREEIGISHVPKSGGSFTIANNGQWQLNQNLVFGSYARLLDDGDVLDGFWEADTICVNYIEITRIDLEDREIEGTFEMHLKMNSQGTHGILYSERINFINGRFKAEIEK